MSSTATVTVWEVTHTTEGPGPFGDGIDTRRFRRKADAETFAAGERLYGSPAVAVRTEAPRHVARRWGLA